MARRPIFQVLLAGLTLIVPALSGCATYNTAQNIRPWGDEALGMDSIAEVTAAWREADGDLRLCAIGSPAERSDNMAMLFPGAAYSIVFPAGLYETGATDAPKLQRTMDPVPEFNLTAGQIEGPCPEPPADWAAVPVRRVAPGDLGVESFAFAEDAALAALFAEGPDGPAVFEFADQTSSYLYYRAAKPAFDGSAVVEVDLALREVEPRPAWILALPFALVFDVATSPVQLAICLFSAGCAS
jgi:hypothetical protein